jgi:hypothetical protein
LTDHDIRVLIFQKNLLCLKVLKRTFYPSKSITRTNCIVLSQQLNLSTGINRNHSFPPKRLDAFSEVNYFFIASNICLCAKELAFNLGQNKIRQAGSSQFHPKQRIKIQKF